MNILVTNDDGIQSGGLARLAAAAKKYGTVYVIAPDGQRSANSHRITLRESMTLRRVDFPVKDVIAYETSGTPADCVRFGILNVVEGKTDLVLSGINDNYNCGSDLQYSATAGAALEAAHAGIHAIAVSEGADGVYEVIDKYLEEILDELINLPLEDNQIWNVNFPSCHLSELQGIQRNIKVARNSFYIDSYTEENKQADGSRELRVFGILQADAAPGTDYKAIMDKYISIGRVSNLR